MPNNSYEKCKRYVVSGLLCLVGGSVMLLAQKIFAMTEYWGSLSAFAGACIILYGNGCIIYGLLVSAGDREAE